MTSATTLKLPEKLKVRVARLATLTDRTPHSLMIEAIEREVEREERHRKFVSEALAEDRAIDRGAPVYAADDVHMWLKQMAVSSKAPRPKPWRG